MDLSEGKVSYKEGRELVWDCKLFCTMKEKLLLFPREESSGLCDGLGTCCGGAARQRTHSCFFKDGLVTLVTVVTWYLALYT